MKGVVGIFLEVAGAKASSHTDLQDAQEITVLE